MPGYPKNIQYVSQSDSLFYIKITGILGGIVFYTSTGDSGKPAVIGVYVEGSPESIRITEISNPLIKIIPIQQKDDTALYFKCNGAVGRKFQIMLYVDSKSNIDYSLLNSIE